MKRRASRCLASSFNGLPGRVSSPSRPAPATRVLIPFVADARARINIRSVSSGDHARRSRSNGAVPSDADGRVRSGPPDGAASATACGVRAGFAPRAGHPGPRARRRAGGRLSLQHASSSATRGARAASRSSASSTRPGASAPTTTRRCCSRPSDPAAAGRVHRGRRRRHDRPRATRCAPTTLVTPAMQSPHESLVLNEKRGLLVAVMGNPDRLSGLRRRLRPECGLPPPGAAVEPAGRAPRPRERLRPGRQHLLRDVAVQRDRSRPST